VRDGVEERGAAALAQNTGHAFQVGANSEQTDNQRRVSNEVTSGDDAAHEVDLGSERPVPLKHLPGHADFNELSV
jgi:hypothetical protein